MSILYVAGVSITDNPKDIADKTLKIISECSVAVGEERKFSLRLLNTAKSNAELYLINEHSTDKDRQEVLSVVKSVEKSVFFSDAGTPCISDPDYQFIKLCRENGVEVRSIPGPSSITSAISVSGIKADKFYFAGFPPREKDNRRKYFEEIENRKITTVFMERPYALESTLKDMAVIKRKISVSINLGMDDEKTYFDYPVKLIEFLSGIKAPFVVVVPEKK